MDMHLLARTAWGQRRRALLWTLSLGLVVPLEHAVEGVVATMAIERWAIPVGVKLVEEALHVAPALVAVGVNRLMGCCRFSLAIHEVPRRLFKWKEGS